MIRPRKTQVRQPQTPRSGAQCHTAAFWGHTPIGPCSDATPEVARLADALDEVQTGHGRVLALVGEPGVGKTRLAQEASLLADERGFLVLVGRCYEERASLPLFPFVDALAAGLAMASEALRQQVPRRWPELGRLLSRRPSVSAASPLGQSDDARLHLFAAAVGVHSRTGRRRAGRAPAG